ncbi:MAG TPA: hypothetical protein VH253_19635 [Phycisphaerae bacterium]|nr:hypothetical protein [Phycisphaerae bacterium]
MITLVIIGTAWETFRCLRPRLEFWLGQRACRTHEFAPADIAYSDDPAIVASLRANPVFYISSSMSRPRLLRLDAPVWSRFSDNLPSHSRSAICSYGDGSAFAFVHEVRSPAGTAFLATVHLTSAPVRDVKDSTEILWWADAFAVYSPITGARISAVHSEGSISIGSAPLTIYCGHSDPADPGHFTIQFVQASKVSIIDAHLDPSDNSLHLTLRP